MGGSLSLQASIFDNSLMVEQSGQCISQPMAETERQQYGLLTTAAETEKEGKSSLEDK